ncbi:MAG: RecQ family ATP-dependent DNA helicase, partial [Planctomycetota bacterium]
MSNPQRVLQEVFGFSEFLGEQRAVIDCILAGRSALAVFPTGGGKSLCYQLPAILQDGLTLVVSPLIALMKDQIDFLRSKGVAAARLDSSQTAEEFRETRSAMKSGELKLLYVSPERLSNEKFVQSMRSVRIDLMVVDEAHCISEWGHNFRPDYLKLVRAAGRLGIAKFLALTATATPKVMADICHAFRVAEGDAIRTSFHRPNLEMHITPTTAAARDELLLQRLQARPRGPAIVYVTLQHTAETVAKRLGAAGLSAKAYHAGMAPEVRHEIQDAFMASEDGIVVATIAFGMGIDKANIRYVYHYNLPKSIENYAQETGRAGRDGAPSICEMFVVAEDRIVLENFVYGDTPTTESVAGVLRALLAQEDHFHLSHYTLSAEHDMRTLVLATLMTWLELGGMLEGIGAFPGEYKFQAKRSSAEILADYDSERAAFLRSVFARARKGRVWLTLDLLATAEVLGEAPERIARAMNYLEEAGDLTLQMSKVVQSYRMLNRPAEPEAMIQSLAERFRQREAADLDRLQLVFDLAASETCRVAV